MNETMGQTVEKIKPYVGGKPFRRRMNGFSCFVDGRTWHENEVAGASCS
jgi:hypothetical protein